MSLTAAVPAGENAFLLGGFIYPVQVKNPEARAALKAGNMALYAKLKVSSARVQHGCLFRLDGPAWRQIDLPTNAKIYDMLRLPAAQGVLIAAGAGTVLRLLSPEEITVAACPQIAEDMVSVCLSEQDVLLASETQLFQFSDDTVDGPIEGPDGSLASMLTLVGTDGVLWAISTERLLKREDGHWREINIPSNFLEVPFRG